MECLWELDEVMLRSFWEASQASAQTSYRSSGKMPPTFCSATLWQEQRASKSAPWKLLEKKIGPCSLAFAIIHQRWSALSMCRQPTTMTRTSSRRYTPQWASVGLHSDAEENQTGGMHCRGVRFETAAVIQKWVHRPSFRQQYNTSTNKSNTIRMP